MSVMSDWDWVVTLAECVQQECVTVIRKNQDRKDVSKRERAERDEEERGTE